MRLMRLHAGALATAWLAVTTAACAQIPAATLTQANSYLQTGQADKALALLTALPTSGTGTDVAQNLLCRVRFQLQQLADLVGRVRGGLHFETRRDFCLRPIQLSLDAREIRQEAL